MREVVITVSPDSVLWDVGQKCVDGTKVIEYSGYRITLIETDNSTIDKEMSLYDLIVKLRNGKGRMF